MHYYQFNIGDYMRDTAHLDEMEDLAYRRMLDLYYLREGPLPADVKEIAKLIRMRTHSECIAYVLQEYFKLTEKGYENSKCDEVLSKIYSKSEKAKAAAEKRWNNQQHKNANASPEQSECNADAMLPNTHNLDTQYLDTQNKDLADSGESACASKEFVEQEFNRFWKHYPTKKSKATAKKSFQKLVAGKSEGKVKFWVDMILNYHFECIENEHIGAKQLYAATLINEKRWEDDPAYFKDFKAQWILENGNGQS